MPVAAPIAAAIIMAAATVGTAIYTQQTMPGAPKPPEPLQVAPPAAPKELPEAATDVAGEADKDAKRMAAAAAARKRAASRLSSGIRQPSVNPLGTVSKLGQ